MVADNTVQNVTSKHQNTDGKGIRITKKHSQVRFDKIFYQDAILVLFGATPPNIITDIHIGEGKKSSFK